MTTEESKTTTKNAAHSVGWWEWLGWKEGSSSAQSIRAPPQIEPKTAASEPEPIPTTSVLAAGIDPKISNPEHTEPVTGWQRVRNIYEREYSMEKDVTIRVLRMSFFGGFLVGGASGYAQARHAYDINNVGRVYLSPSDAVKRRLDYAIVRFAKSGFGTGIKCALISGSIVFLSTTVTAYRDKFASWYFPAISAIVGGIFTFPVGLVGSMKAVGLGVTSGLTLTAVVNLYALAVDKPLNDAYRHFKRDYEKGLKTTAEWEYRVKEIMERENIVWRRDAIKKLKRIDQEKLTIFDD